MLGIHRVLTVLADAPSPMSITEVGVAIGVDQPRASRLVQALQDEGLVRREPDPRDARRATIVLTERGRAHASERRARRAEPVAQALATLTPEEREQLAGLLARLAEAWPRP